MIVLCKVTGQNILKKCYKRQRQISLLWQCPGEADSELPQKSKMGVFQQ